MERTATDTVGINDTARDVRDKVARLRVIEAEAAQLRAALLEIQDSIKDALGESPTLKPRRHPRRSAVERSGRPVRPGSNIAAAVDVLTAAGTPQHIDVLWPRVCQVVKRRVTKAGLVGALSEYVRKGLIFTRPETSTYGLVVAGNGNGWGNGNGHGTKDVVGAGRVTGSEAGM